MHNYALSSRQGRENQRWITSKDKVLSKLRNYCANNHNDPSSISIAQHNDNDNYQLHMNVQDGVKIRLLAGCVPLTNDGHVIFVSSSKHPDQWILPKGGWEQDETLTEAAKRETYEEAGLLGRLGPPLENDIVYRSKSLNKWNNLQMFPMFVEHILQNWPESATRNRRLMTVAEGIEYAKRSRPQLVGVLEEVARIHIHASPAV